MAITRRTDHFWRGHVRAADQVIDVTITVIEATAQNTVVVFLAAGVTGITGDFRREFIHFVRRSILDRLAMTSAVRVLIGNGLFIPVAGFNRMNSNRANGSAESRDKQIRIKTYIRMMHMMNDQAVENC